MKLFFLHIFILVIIINKLINSKEEIYLEVALIINKSLYDDKKIAYYTYKVTEEKILQRIKIAKLGSL